MKYPLEACLGSRVRVMSRKIDGIYRKHFGNSGITENQLSIMMALYKTGLVEQKMIGSVLSLEKSSLSRNLVRLIKAGYIKKIGPVNRPSIELTLSGKSTVEALTPSWELAMDEIHKVLRGEDLEALEKIEQGLSKL